MAEERTERRGRREGGRGRKRDDRNQVREKPEFEDAGKGHKVACHFHD